MRSTLLPLVALPFAAQAIESALNLATADDNRMVQLPGILKFPVTGNVDTSLAKRQDGSPLGNQLNGNFYTIPLLVGTPGDRVDVVFDTGSWELWVNPVCSKARQPEFCAKFGRLQKSSSIVNLGQSGTLTYGTGYATVDYVEDSIVIGSAKIEKQVFGVAKDSAFWETGIMGAGPSPNGFNDPQAQGHFVVDSLAKQGITKSRAFGLDLQGMDSQRGSVVFGGVDTKKFRGTLEKLPIVPAASAPDGFTRYWVNLESIAHTSGGKTTTLHGQRQAVFLDSGAQLSALPPAVVEDLLKAFPGAKLDQYGGYQVDCSLRKSTDTLDFTLGNKVIRVSYADFIYQFPGVTTSCVLGFQADHNNTYNLGDSFLRSAYVVYDQDHEELSVAQADDCGTHLVAIGPGPAGPIVGECHPETPTSTTTSATVTPTSSTTHKTTHSETKTTESQTSSQTSSKTKSHTKTGTTTAPPVTSSGTGSHSTGASSTPWGNSTTTAKPTYTSTFTTTKVYTITSCPPVVTNCPVGHKTTEIIEVTTTWCPGNEQPVPTQSAIVPPGPCPGKGHCPPVEQSSEVATNVPVPTTEGNVPVPTTEGGMTTIAKPTGTQPAGNSTGVPPPPVTAGASQVFQGLGMAVLVAAVAALL